MTAIHMTGAATASAVLWWALSSSAFAQSAAPSVASPPVLLASAAPTSEPAADASTQAEGLKEVVVTAQRRTENAQRLPLSVTALDSADLEDKAVTNLSGLQYASPALSISDSGIFQNINIRGIGLSTTNPNVVTGVAEYIDGLFQAPLATESNFYDLDGVEVLRGPQGTLVGASSTGGAIYIKSRSPELDKTEGYFEAGYGTYNEYETQGAINLPISDDVAFRAAGFYRGHDSFYTDIGSYHNDPDMLSEKGGRIGLLWKPGSFQALLKVQINDRETGGYPAQPVPGTVFAPYKVGGPRTLDYDAPTANHDQTLLTSAELRQELPDGIVIRSLSGYQHQKVDNLNDLDNTDAPASAGGDWREFYSADGRTYSEEINIISPTDGAFSWIVGGYFQRDEVDVALYDTQAGFPTATTPNNERTTTGVFAQGNYHLTDSLELQLGGRYSGFRESGSGAVTVGQGIPGFPPDGLPVANLAGTHKDSRGTGKAALNWTLNDSNMVYALAARGYKPGGFNSLVSQFDPETVNSYEIGWKPSFLDNHIHAQLDAFYNDYRDFQYQVMDLSTGQAGIQNIENMKTEGLEAQVQGQLGALGLDANVAYLDSKVPSFSSVNVRTLPPGTLGPQCPAGLPSQPPVCFDYAPYTQTLGGGANVYSPRWTYNLGVDYRFDVGGDMTLKPRLNYAYIGSQFTYLAYSPISDRLAGYGLLSAQLTLNLPKWWVEIYGTNLTGQTYVAGQYNQTVNEEFYGAPRQGGVRGGFHF